MTGVQTCALPISNPAYTYTPAEFFTFTLFMPTAMADLVYSRPDNMGGAIRKGRVTTAGTWTVTSAIVATPESASVVLLGSGLAGFAIVGRRRRIQRAG